MENSNGMSNGYNKTVNNGYMISSHLSTHWLDLRVFFIRVSKCEIDDSSPEYLTLNHIPLYPGTLVEINGVRTSMNADGATTFLRRDRLDRKSEETTFVSTDSIRMTGSVRFEVFDKDVLVLSGVLELCDTNGFAGESRSHCQSWRINIDSDITIDTCFLKAKQFMGLDSVYPTMEVYIAGFFSDSPIILTKSFQLMRKRQMRMAALDSIPECEASEQHGNFPSRLTFQTSDYANNKSENEEYDNPYSGIEYFDGEDGELSWFNAGVRVGVGIGLSICVGVGIGVGLLVRTYQGTTRNFRRRLL